MAVIARYTRDAFAASLVIALAGCGSDRGVPENIAGGYDGGGLGGVTGDACYSGAGQTVPADGLAVITLDASTRHQTMQGFGASMRLFDDPRTSNTSDPATGRATAVPSDIDQGAILDALHVDLGLTRVRFLPGDGVEPVNDDADPLVTDRSRFDFGWNRGDGQIDRMADLARRGVTTWFVAPPALEKWMTPADPAEYAEWAIVMLRHWKERGRELPYFSLVDQPSAAAGGGLSGEYLRDVARLLGARIEAEGMKTRLVIPDDVSPKEAYARLQIILADPEARRHVGAIAYHLYARGPEEGSIRQLAEQHGIPVWMTDFSTSDADWFTWATALHELIADGGASAVDYKWGFSGSHEQSQLVRLLVADGAYSRFIRTQQYYVTGQYSRYVRPGAVRISATSSDPAIKATAYVDGTRVIVIATFVPPPGVYFDRRVRIELGSGGPCVRQADVVRTSAAESWLSLGNIKVDVPRIVTTLPINSVTTLVGQQ